MDARLIELQKHIDALFKSVDEAYDAAAKAAGISSSAQDILYALLVYGEGLTQKQICDCSYNNKQTINSAIHKLEKQGILQMRAGVGRETRVSLTNEGIELANRVVLPIAEAEQRALESIPEKLREQLLAVVEQYAATLTSSLADAARTMADREEA